MPAVEGLTALALTCGYPKPESYEALYRDAAHNGTTPLLIEASLMAPRELKARYAREALRHGCNLDQEHQEALRRQLIEHADMKFAYRALCFLNNLPNEDRQTLKVRFVNNATPAYAQFALHEIGDFSPGERAQLEQIK